MIKFDSSHKEFDKKIDNKIGKKVKNMIVSGLLIFSIISLSGCCDIKENHTHKYVSDNGFSVYLNSEIDKRFFGDDLYEKTDDYIIVDDEEKKLYNFLDKNWLIKIEDNEEAIYNYLDIVGTEPFYEYEYHYYKALPKGATTGYSWTKDPNHGNLTGNKRISYPVYYGYNVIKDENGNYILDRSKPYKSYEKLVNDGYKYISCYLQDFIKISVVEDIKENNEENYFCR